MAHGLADQAGGTERKVLARRALREARRGVTVWASVWRQPTPTRWVDKVRYAGAYSYVSALRSGVRVRRMIGSS